MKHILVDESIAYLTNFDLLLLVVYQHVLRLDLLKDRRMKEDCLLM